MMERKSEIPYIDFRLLHDGWLVIFHFSSDAGNWEDKSQEHFRIEFVFPLRDTKLTLEEAKLKAYDYFKNTFKDVAAIVEKTQFDSLMREDRKSTP